MKKTSVTALLPAPADLFRCFRRHYHLSAGKRLPRLSGGHSAGLLPFHDGNYLISIVGRLGSNSSHVGTALFIATISAAPVLGLTIRKIDSYRPKHPV